MLQSIASFVAAGFLLQAGAFRGKDSLREGVSALFLRGTVSDTDLNATNETNATNKTNASADLELGAGLDLNKTNKTNASIARAGAYAEAFSMGLSANAAADMGVEWKAAGLRKEQIIGGIDTECDGNQFDTLDVIDKKAKYACETGLAGMMNWRMDNDYFEKDGKCTFGWPKPVGAGQTFKGTYQLRDSVNKYCKDKPKPVLAGYVGFGINYDMQKDTWNAREGKALYKAIPYDAVDRVYLAFAEVKQCEFQQLPDWTHDLVKHAKGVNSNLELYITTATPAAQYMNGNAFCSEAPQKQRFTQSLLQTLDKYGFDGYDIDWEEGIDKQAYSSLIQHVGSAFKSTKYSLTMAVWPTYSEGQYDLASIRDYVKHVSLMSYGGSAESLRGNAQSFLPQDAAE